MEFTVASWIADGRVIAMPVSPDDLERALFEAVLWETFGPHTYETLQYHTSLDVAKDRAREFGARRLAATLN